MSDTPQPADYLVNLAIALIDSGLDILNQDNLSDDQLKYNSALIPGASLGRHFRHVSETYEAFNQSLRSDPYDALHINYDAIMPPSRKSIARSVEACREAMTKVREGLVALHDCEDLEAELEREVEVVALSPQRQELKSTLGRELWFCSLHAIHHYTMIRVIACHELGMQLPVEFGTAPSTILYRGKDWKPPVVAPFTLKAKM